jgi:hypothetical protein
MDDSELASILAAHEARAVGYYNSEIADEQARALNYYYGRMDDLKVLEGCSAVVDHSVAVMVDNALAAVLKPFVSADEVVSFDPRGPEDQAQAAQATEYVNYVINCDNPGFLILHNWFKDALLTKIGVVKAWWEDRSRAETRTVVMDAAQLEAARASPDYLGETDRRHPAVQLQEIVADGRVRIESVPPEEFLITPFARSIEEAAYVAHRPSNYTRSDLIELGFDAGTVDALPAFAGGRGDEARSQARYRDEDWFSGMHDGAAADRSREVIGIVDEYVRVDHDGDGVSELRRVIRVDDTILFNEPAEDIPFALLCPCPMPHKIYGRGLADQALEGQKVSTAVLRQTLDNLYKTNNPRPVIGDLAIGDSTMDDLGDSAPGAIIRVRNSGQIDWAAVPFTAQHSFPMLEYIARSTEEQTGFQRKGNGFNAEALRKNSPNTATQAAIDENSRNERAEMIARIFAETGVKRLFRLVLSCSFATSRGPNHPPAQRWVPMDPSGWNAEMDLTISVGLGIGNRQEQIAQANEVLQTMAELQRSPFAWLVDATRLHNALKRRFNAAGIKNVNDFLADPAQMTPPPTPPDPAAARAEQEAQLQAAELQGRQQEAALKLQLMREEANLKLQQQRDEAAARLQLDREKVAAEIALARERMLHETELARERLRMPTRSEPGFGPVSSDADAAVLTAGRPGGDLDK